VAGWPAGESRPVTLFKAGYAHRDEADLHRLPDATLPKTWGQERVEKSLLEVCGDWASGQEQAAG
jgi:hypothetical protein